MQFLTELENLLKERKNTLPEKSYTANLFREGDDRILKKVIEEAGEFLLAVKNKDREEIIHECADLIFHTLMALVNSGVDLETVTEELKKRHR